MQASTFHCLTSLETSEEKCLYDEDASVKSPNIVCMYNIWDIWAT